jgi:hypothetical protein
MRAVAARAPLAATAIAGAGACGGGDTDRSPPSGAGGREELVRAAWCRSPECALVEHHAFDGAVGLVIRTAGDLRYGEPQLFEVDRGS